MEGMEFIFAILAALTALLIVIVVYKMAMKQKNVDLLKEQLRKKRLQDMKDGAEFSAMTSGASGASGLGAADMTPPVTDGDQHFRPSC